MAQQNHKWSDHTVPSALANSYGPELNASEFQQYPPPQVQSDDGASAPQVVERTNPKPVEYEPYPGPGIAPPEQGPDGWAKRGTILGLTKPIFFLVVGLVILVVLGVALGAGLGVGLSNNNGEKVAQTSAIVSPSSTPTSSSTPNPDGQSKTTSPPATATSPHPTSSSSEASSSSSKGATSTSSAPVTKGTTGLAANSCTFPNPQTFYIGNTGFTEYCFTDWPNGEETFDGKGNVTDLSRGVVYTFQACMQACLDFNAEQVSGATLCTAVTYNSNLTSILAVGKQGGNCFLKDKKGVNQQGSAESACAALAN